MTIRASLLLLAVSLSGAMLLSGCSDNFQPSALTDDVAAPQTPVGHMAGSVHGGNFPVTGAQVYLFATGTGGYKTASTSLIRSGNGGVSCNAGAQLNGTTYSAYSNACYVYTDTYGDFALSGDYSCTAGQQVYMVAVGGNPGLGGSAPFSTTATFSNVTNTITVASATGIAVGSTVSGTGVGGTVTAVSGTTVTLSQNNTAAGTNVAVTFSAATTATLKTTSKNITVASATGIAVGMTVSGTGIPAGATVTGGAGTTTITLKNTPTIAGSNVAVTFSISTTATLIPSNTITVANASGIATGMAIGGTGVGGTVTAVSGTTVTLSQNNTAAGTNVAVTFSTTTATVTANSYTITVASATGITAGMAISGSGVGGIVTAVNGTTLTLSQTSTATGTAVPVVFWAPVNNPYLVQMVGLGQCPAAGNLAAQDPYVDIDEMTTMAFANAMAPFAKDEFDIGTDGTTAGATAIQIAMANSMNIVDIAHGTAPPSTLAAGSSGTPAMTKITALADVLAGCVNTAGTLTSGTGCYNLLNQTLGGIIGGKSVYDESQSAFYMAQNPTGSAFNNILTTLTGTLVWSVPTFNVPLWNKANPTMAPGTIAPTDWTLPIVYQNVVSSQPGNISFDSFGNAWVSDRGNNAVVKITPTGVVSKFTNLNNGSSNGSIYQVVVDPSNVIWALDYTNSVIYRLNTAGSWLSTVSGNQLSGPIAISFNSFGSAVVVNSGSGYISRFSASGLAQTPATYNQSGSDGYGSLGAPLGIAVDSGGNAFLPENGGCACVGILANNATNTFAYDDYSGTVTSASAIAVDGSNDAWQAQSSNNTIVENPTYAGGTYQDYSLNFFNLFPTLSGYYYNLVSFFGFPIATAPTTVTGGGMNKPVALAFDGGGQLWVANAGSSAVSGFNGTTSLAGTAGFQTGASATSGSYSVATDPAGNVWTVNSDGSVTEILGIATPTATPVYPGQIGVKP